MKQYKYPDMTKTQRREGSQFILHIEGGEFTDSEIVVLLGEVRGNEVFQRTCDSASSNRTPAFPNCSCLLFGVFELILTCL